MTVTSFATVVAPRKGQNH